MSCAPNVIRADLTLAKMSGTNILRELPDIVAEAKTRIWPDPAVLLSLETEIEE